MGSLSPWHLLILALLALLLFGGRGKLSGIMGDAAKGIKAFKEGLKDDEQKQPPASPAAAPLPPTESAKTETAKQEDKHTAA